MYTATPLKDNRRRDQVQAAAPTFACNFEQFFSS